MGNQGITEEIGGFVAGLRYEDLTPAVLNRARNCILDGTGVMLAGLNELSVKIIRDFILSSGSSGESTLLGKGQNRVPAHFAALLYGIAGHSMDWDDTAISIRPDRGVLLHPTMPPLASGLSVGEVLHVSGREFLAAFIAGFEVECKLAESISVDHRTRGYHTSGTCGIFGSTVTASKLMKLPLEKVQMALGIAASMSAGIDVQLGTMTKPLHVGRASENGVTAASLARLGFEASPHALEGPEGFYQAYGGDFEPSQISGKLGLPFSIMQPGASVKPYPCGVVGQSIMDAVRTIKERDAFRHEEVDFIKVRTSSNILPPKGPLKYRRAENALQAKFCIPFQVAAIVIRNKAGMMEFTDEFVRSPEVQDMMNRVETNVEPSFDVLGSNRYMGIFEVHLRNGRILEGKTPELLRGSPENPLSYEELTEKFRDCVQNSLTPGRALELIDIIEKIETLDDIGVLANFLAIS